MIFTKIDMKKANSFRKCNAGFSLMEVVIAIGVVALLITAFMAVFSPTQKSIADSLSVKDANRLSSSLEDELAILRPEEAQSNTYKSSFDKAFQWIKNSGTPATAVLVYQYKAHPTNQNSDGTLVAYDPQVKGVPGRDYITQTVVRRRDSAYLTNELKPGVVTGPVYVVRLTQLVPDAGSLKLGTMGQIQDSAAVAAATSDVYGDASIAFQAEFFRLKSNQEVYVKSNAWDFIKLGSPQAVRNMAVRR